MKESVTAELDPRIFSVFEVAGNMEKPLEMAAEKLQKLWGFVLLETGLHLIIYHVS